jgi:hypothetical protein
MFCIDSGDFLNDLVSFGFNSAKQIFLFLTFTYLLYVKPTNHFATSFFQEIEDREKNSMGNTTRRKKRRHHTGPLLDHVVRPISPSCIQLMQTSALHT